TRPVPTPAPTSTAWAAPSTTRPPARRRSRGGASMRSCRRITRWRPSRPISFARRSPGGCRPGRGKWLPTDPPRATPPPTRGEGGKKAEIRIPAGTRAVEVTKDGFTAFGEKVVLSDGTRRVLEARLEPQPRVEHGLGGPSKAGEVHRAGEERDDNALKMKFCW